MTKTLNSILDFDDEYPLDFSIKSCSGSLVVAGFLDMRNDKDYNLIKLVYEQNPKRVWSVFHSDGCQLIKNGLHHEKDYLYTLITIEGCKTSQDFVIRHGKEL